MKRRGQATPISVAIMIAATLALALAVYAYFQGRMSIVEEERLLSVEIASTAAMIDMDVISWSSNSSASPTVACYYLDVMNIGDIRKVFWLTVLPLDKQGEYYLPGPEINVVPVDQDAGGSGLNIYFYYFQDSNGDGELEIVGNTGTLFNVPPPCSAFRGNNTALAAAIPLTWVGSDRVFLGSDSPNLSYLGNSIAGVAMNKGIPFLRLDLGPRSTVSILVYVQVDDWDVSTEILPLPDSLYMAVFTQYNGNMYLSTAFKLPSG
ncbi:MAG: hypothetical protein GSR86_06670 [Desulfurococcales archaeon]|nr:hypothetical protein [Desulfurococcales archaeon]